jgi:hypothetical protein|tara:strand:+ start:320 stop:580 length:261 start_codon:yes stop_codon:yes gene_type:complete
MVERVVQPSSERPLVNANGSPSAQFNGWLRVISERSLIIGEGSPDGVVSASQGAEYMDRLGSAGAIKYIKRDADIGGNKALGWVAI